MISSKRRDLFSNKLPTFPTYTVKFGSCIVCSSSKVLIIRPNTTIQIRYINILLCTKHVIAVQINHLQEVSDTQKEYTGREAIIYSGTNYKNIIPKKGIIRLKLIHNYVTEFLTYNQCVTGI